MWRGQIVDGAVDGRQRGKIHRSWCMKAIELPDRVSAMGPKLFADSTVCSVQRAEKWATAVEAGERAGAACRRVRKRPAAAARL